MPFELEDILCTSMEEITRLLNHHGQYYELTEGLGLNSNEMSDSFKEHSNDSVLGC